MPESWTFHGLTKRFGSTQALDDVQLQVKAGEIHGLVGHNGSGKSTLIKLLAGYHKPDGKATVEAWGKRYQFPLGQVASGQVNMRFVHQDLGLILTRTITENLFLNEIGSGARTFISDRHLNEQARTILRGWDLHWDVTSPVFRLSPTERANLAVARALMSTEDDERQPLLVLDEPTAHLPEEDKTQLYQLVRRVTNRGGAVLFVSHFLDEVMELCDRVTVLRDGVTTAQGRPVGGMTKHELTTLIAPHYSERTTIRPALEPGTQLVRFCGLATKRLAPLDLEVSSGEVLGVTGLTGSGHEDLPGAVFGIVPAEGTCQVGYQVLKGGSISPRSAMAAGVGYIPPSRSSEGVLADQKVFENLMMLNLEAHHGATGLSANRLRRAAHDLAAKVGIRPLNVDMKVAELSGGNAQKVVVAKWLALKPQLLLACEPTHGVDVGSRADINDLIVAHARRGHAVVCSSMDASQLVEICDRVVVFAEGKPTGVLEGARVTEANITHLSFGESEQPSAAPIKTSATGVHDG